MSLLGLIVDRIITCNGKGEKDVMVNADWTRWTVLINPQTGRIMDIISGEPELTNIEFYSFPPGSTLMPGFIDCHVHLSIATDDYQMDHLRLSSADKVLRALRFAQGLLQAGFTTLRSAGDADTYYPTFALARAINRGEFVGPRIIGAGHYISVTGGGGDISFLAPDNCPCGLTEGIIADGPDEMVKAVRREIKYGSDWIKILATGAFMSASTGPKDSPENTHFSPAELTACVQEARRRQVHVMAHAHGADGIKQAALAGVRSIEHASYIDDEGIAACLRTGAWIVPTFSVGEHFGYDTSVDSAQSRLIELQIAGKNRYYGAIRRAAAAGVKVALGSDFVGWDPAITAREFQYLVKYAHMTPLQAIYAGTSSAAELLEYPDLGRIYPGCIADIVIVNGNPLDDITLLETGVICVVRDGKVVKRVTK
mmetsp:Transcript_20613/g.29587  ORF Transcript_20613/g.29587 Transcript_20613/m.29587 type:complete len:426 (-) Transcript_20613:15-1292(-)